MKKFFCSKPVYYTILICFLYAAGDEIHQYFVPGRACRMLDILIDTSGSVFFCFIYSFVMSFLTRRKKIQP